MFFAICFEIVIAIKKEDIPEIKIVKITKDRMDIVKFGISWLIATAAPVLVL